MKMMNLHRFGKATNWNVLLNLVRGTICSASSSIDTFCHFFFLFAHGRLVYSIRSILYFAYRWASIIEFDDYELNWERRGENASTIATNEMLVNLINTLPHYGLHFFRWNSYVNVAQTSFYSFSSSCLLHLCLYQTNTIRQRANSSL